MAERARRRAPAWQQPVSHTNGKLEKPPHKEHVRVSRSRPQAPLFGQNTVTQHRRAECDGSEEPDERHPQHHRAQAIHSASIPQRVRRSETMTEVKALSMPPWAAQPLE